MKHITILYGDDNTGKLFICQQAGWEVLSGTPQQIHDALTASTNTEFGVPLDTAEDQGLHVGPVREVVHAFANANGFMIRYADLRVI